MRHQYSAPMVSAPSSSPRNASTDLDRSSSSNDAEIDEVVIVNRQRARIVLFTLLREQAYFVRVRHAGSPHARTGGKDREGVRANPVILQIT
jgi:hypothetical protein